MSYATVPGLAIAGKKSVQLFSFFTNLLEPLSFLIYAICFSVRVKNDSAARTKVLFLFYITFTVLMAYASYIVFYKGNNNWIYNLSYLPAGICISYYFYKLFRSKEKKNAIKWLAAVNLVYFLIKNTLFSSISGLDSFGYSLLCVTIILIIFMYYHHVMNNITENRITYSFDFWLVSGYLLYFSGCFFIFLTWSYLTVRISDTYTDEQRTLLTMLWGVHNILLFLSATITLAGNSWITYRKK